MNGHLPLPPVLSHKLSEFRRRVWTLKLVEGLLAAVVGLAVSYLLVLALDRFWETPVWLRMVCLVLGAAVPGLGLPLQWHRWVWKQRRLEDAARLLRWKFPRLGDQLLGIVELARTDSVAAGRSERLVQAAMAQADEAVKHADFSDAVPHARHRQWGWAAGAALAVTVTGAMAMPEAARNALARWLMPWKPVERFTFARVQDLPNPLVVPLAEPYTLPVLLSKDSRWKPDTATGRLPGQPAITGNRQQGRYVIHVPPQQQDLSMQLKVGDVRRTVQVQPRPRPELTDLKIRLKLPEYLQYTTEPVIEVRGGAVQVLQGASASLEASASRALVEASMDGVAARVQEGKLFTEARPVDGPKHWQIYWKDTLGLTARVPLQLELQPVEDQKPRLAARRETQGQVVLDSEVVAFDLQASDDFGLRRLSLAWKSIPSQDKEETTVLTGSKIVAAGAPERREMETRATFCATREGVPPGTYEVRGTAEDYLTGREAAVSASFVLHVLSQTDHALWVTREMGKWLESARETYEREQQLHQVNKELRQLSATELDRPENRRKVALQSSAENANAARLSSLNAAGRTLVENATKNPEFEAARLESWATMLQSLQEIAANRMPDVADLLKQSADAKADGKASPASGATPANATASNPSSSKSSGEPAGKAPGSKSEPSSPSIALGAPPPPPSASGEAADPDAKPVEKAPSIQLTESTMNPKATPPASGEEGPPKPPSPGRLTLPTNTLAAAPGGAKKEEDPAADSSAQQPLEEGIGQQKELLAEFARATDQLTEILSSLEASTFVKRFKAASREQTQLASGINQETLDAFGIVRSNAQESRLVSLPEKSTGGDEAAEEKTESEKGTESEPETDVANIGPVAPAAPAAVTAEAEEKKESSGKPAKEEEVVFVTAFAPAALKKATEQKEIVRIIQSDLEAYFQRKPDQHFKKVIGEMKETRVVDHLGKVGSRAAENLSGNAIHAAEYWADTMDRWAEEMVAAGECSNCSSCSADSLPPEIVLKVMQALRDEMKLRDETRELENARTALESAEYTTRTARLAAEQERISVHTQGAMEDITALPEGSKKFGKELKLLTAVVAVMGETTGLLGTPDTGAPVIAAETEAIELLLQTKRPNPKGGGGGGSQPGGSQQGGGTRTAALANLGPGGDAAVQVKARPVGQATGRAGKEFPEEFKTGLDAYFSNLEETATP